MYGNECNLKTHLRAIVTLEGEEKPAYNKISLKIGDDEYVNETNQHQLRCGICR